MFFTNVKLEFYKENQTKELFFTHCFGFSVKIGLVKEVLLYFVDDYPFYFMTPFLSILQEYFTPFHQKLEGVPIPTKLNNPFDYKVPEIAKIAVKEVQENLLLKNFGHDFGLIGESGLGKMVGVLVAKDDKGNMGYLVAFSGKLEGGNFIKGFVPPVFDTFEEGGFYKVMEVKINGLNHKISTMESSLHLLQTKENWTNSIKYFEEEVQKLKDQHNHDKKTRDELRQKIMNKGIHDPTGDLLLKLNNESARQHFEMKDFRRKCKINTANWEEKIKKLNQPIQQLKEQRKKLSANLQQSLFEKYTFLNALGEEKSLKNIFISSDNHLPPSGAGECSAPKLLQFAYKNQLIPLALAEFWWGKAPSSEIRKHRQYYPACRLKCYPILNHMLVGLHVDPLSEILPVLGEEVPVIYEDESIIVLNKPQPFLSVPGKLQKDSVLERLKKAYPDASGPLLVHRLDMSTSGIMVAAKSKEGYIHLQKQFLDKKIQKRYIAILDGELQKTEGRIDLPLRVDLDNRPRQLICFEHGKPSTTLWKKIETLNGRTRILFIPLTGRTHQLRVHSAHKDGLGIPILGDDLYGVSDERLYLHAEHISFQHPVTKKMMSFTVETPF
ncbi:MAG: pseudouridine synthase [Saprospiraceae bacterium]